MRVAKQQQKEIRIDLTGPDGNAFALMSHARRIASQLDYTKEEINEMLIDMRSSDYKHLIEVFDKHFGEFVILEE